ncbi:MAG: hypothetical protein OXE50_15090, partial [Chloroflexi bacterium]|nr:hypothetical protein [Chloroflexota bacterium]
MKSDKVNLSKRKDIVLANEALPSNAPISTLEDEMGATTDEKLLEECSYRMAEAMRHWEHIFTTCREDLEFLYEQQWPDYAIKDRQNRPMLTLNQLPQYVFSVVNEARQTKFSINIKQISGKNTDIYDRELA